jgi:hypothetical protein
MKKMSLKNSLLNILAFLFLFSLFAAPFVGFKLQRMDQNPDLTAAEQVVTMSSDVRATPQVRHAMAAYRAEYTTCAWCGKSNNIEVHHKLPVKQAPTAAHLATNFISLCRTHHFDIGHCAKGWDWYESNIDKILSERRPLK